MGPARHRDQQRGLRPAAHGVQPRRRRMGRRRPRASARHVRRVAAGVPVLARAGEATRAHLRPVDQHRDRAAPVRRRGAVELRRGQGRRAGVHRSGRDRDGAVRRDREHDHARREHAPRADRLAHGTRGAADGRRRVDPRDPVHVAEFGAYLASPDAGWISGQTFQVRGGIVEHVETGRCATPRAPTIGASPPTTTAREIPRLFGAAAKRADPPPPGVERATEAAGQSRASVGTSTSRFLGVSSSAAPSSRPFLNSRCAEPRPTRELRELRATEEHEDDDQNDEKSGPKISPSMESSLRAKRLRRSARGRGVSAR